MDVSVKDLRYRTRQVLQSLRRGVRPRITHRGHPIARLVPVRRGESKGFRPIGYGMWARRSDLKNVHQWLDAQRKPRFAR